MNYLPHPCLGSGTMKIPETHPLTLRNWQLSFFYLCWPFYQAKEGRKYIDYSLMNNNCIWKPQTQSCPVANACLFYSPLIVPWVQLPTLCRHPTHLPICTGWGSMGCPTFTGLGVLSIWSIFALQGTWVITSLVYFWLASNFIDCVFPTGKMNVK